MQLNLLITSLEQAIMFYCEESLEKYYYTLSKLATPNIFKKQKLLEKK